MPPTRLIEFEYVSVKRWRHGLLMYNVNDSFIGRSIDLYGEWCDAELAILGQLLQPGDIAIDVGANIGTHTVFFARAVGKKGAVIALEPQRIIFQFLCANVALNALINVHCSNVGVGAEYGSIIVPVLDPTKKMNFGALSLGTAKNGERVDVITLDEFQLARCNLIKIDVEGAEAEVLLGARQTIERCHPVLFVENNTIDRSREIIETIHGLGYKCWWHISPYYNEKNYFQNENNVFAKFQPEANLLCFPEGYDTDIKGLTPIDGADDNWQKALQRMHGT